MVSYQNVSQNSITKEKNNCLSYLYNTPTRSSGILTLGSSEEPI